MNPLLFWRNMKQSSQGPWWRHQIDGKKSALLALRAGTSPVTVNSPHKGQWRGASIFSLIYAWINGWVNNREAGDLGRHPAHYDGTIMKRRKKFLGSGAEVGYLHKFMNCTFDHVRIILKFSRKSVQTSFRNVAIRYVFPTKWIEKIYIFR